MDNSPAAMYAYVASRLGMGEPLAVVQGRALKRYGNDKFDAIDKLLLAATQAYLAASLLHQLDPSQPLPDSQIPSVPSADGTTQIRYVMQVYSNPGEYIWAVTTQIKSVSLQALELIARAAMALWKSIAGHDTVPFGPHKGEPKETEPLEGPGFTAYRGGAADVPPGYFRVKVSRIEREYGPF